MHPPGPLTNGPPGILPSAGDTERNRFYNPFLRFCLTPGDFSLIVHANKQKDIQSEREERTKWMKEMYTGSRKG